MLPEKLLIGAATAAHQVEGNNINSDYWAILIDGCLIALIFAALTLSYRCSQVESR